VNSLGQDKYLLEGLAIQDKNAIESIYKSNFTMIQNLIINNKGTLNDAEDIFQEAMIVLYQKSIDKEFQLNCQLKTYLYSVSKRLWLKKLQSIQRFGIQADDVEDFISVESDLQKHQQEQNQFSIMEKAMERIGEPCKSLLEAYYIHRKQMQEIANQFNYTNADNAKTQKYKCLVRLKKLFFAEYKIESNDR
jgi:RNA polymerase sigma factor (sigma-70 family)